MSDTTSSPLIVPLLCVLRCLVPVLVLFGISFLLRHFGFITQPPPEPKEESKENNHSGKGDLVHGSV
jgi:hypothetical protein